MISVIRNGFFLSTHFLTKSLDFDTGSDLNECSQLNGTTFWLFGRLIKHTKYFSLTMYRLQKKWRCLRKIPWKSTWTLFGPQRSIFVQFFDTRARFTSQRPHSTIRRQPKVLFVSENHPSRRSQSYRPRERTYFWGLRGTLWTKIGLKTVPEAQITTSFRRIARGRCWWWTQSPHLSLSDQYWAQ